MSHRIDLNTLSPTQRTQLVTLMLNYLTDAVVADHTSIIHTGLELFTGHRAYIQGMEDYLLVNTGAAFVPLPFWNSANPIPPEFNVVKNPGAGRPPLANLSPNLPKPPQFEFPAVCEYDDPAQLGNDINGWHGSVHCAIGGTMCILAVASAAPIFWCWHSFVDHVYWDWQRCTVPVPDTKGCTVEVAKKKIRAAGLRCGPVSYAPQCVATDRCCPPRQDPDPERYMHASSESPHDNGGHDHGSQEHAHTGPHGADDHQPSPEFTHPKPDYSYLRNGPRVIGQLPAPSTTAKVGSQVSLAVSDY